MAKIKCKKKNKCTFREVLANPYGKKTVEAIEHIDMDRKDKILQNIRQNLKKELKDKFGYTYRD